MAQSVINHQAVLVSKTLHKRLVNAGALCSDCMMPANIHGGHVPCLGAHIILDAEIIRSIQVNNPLPLSTDNTEADFEKNFPTR